MIKLRESLEVKHMMLDRAAPYMPSTAVNCEMTRDDIDSIDRTFGYRMQATIYVDFWANAAQFDRARENAEKLILNRVYDDVLRELHLIRSTLFARDTAAAIVLIDKLETALLTP